MNYRSVGYLIAFDFKTQTQRDDFLTKCYKNKLLLNKAGQKTVRIRPNLAISKEEVDEFLSIVLDSI